MSTKPKAAKTVNQRDEPEISVVKLPIIDGREAVPVRLLPLATAWRPPVAGQVAVPPRHRQEELGATLTPIIATHGKMAS